MFVPSSHDYINRCWETGHLAGLKLWPQQQRIYNTIQTLPKQAKIVVMLCARQYGKSVLGALLALEDILQNPGIVVIIVAPEIKQARAIVRPRMKLLLGDAPDGLITHIKSEDTWLAETTGSEIVLGGFDITNASRQRGKTIHRIYIEEIVKSNPDDYTSSLKSDLGPAMMHSKAGQIRFMTTLPDIPDHPFITETIPEAQLHGAYFEYTIDQNEALDEEQKAAAIALAGGRGSIECERELYCKQVRDPSVVVVPGYCDVTNVADLGAPAPGHYLVVTDWGGVRDKSVSLLMVYSYLMDIDYVLDERVHDSNTPSEEIWSDSQEMARSYTQKWTNWADVPGQLLVDLVAAGNIISVPPKDDWQAGINQMNVRIGQRKLKIHPRCEFLRLSLRSGTFNKQKTDFARTIVLGHCDALAALSYGIRVLDRTNPYPDQAGGQGYYVPPSGPEGLEAVGASMGLGQRFAFQRTNKRGFKR